MHSAQQVVPFGPVDVAERQIEPAHDVGVQLLAVQNLRDVIDRRRVGGGDDAVDVDVAHQRDLVLQRLGHVAVAAQDQRVRSDTDAAQRVHRVLGGFGLQLSRRRQVRDQRHVQEEDVLPADVVTNLARRLEEGLRLDIADRPADLGDDHVRPPAVGVRLGHRQDATLDLVGDVRDDLDRVPEVLAAALLGDDRRIHLSGSDIRRPGQIAVQEALVVADVEVGFGAVLGDEHLAVLERVHGARIDVEVGIELLHRHLQPAGGQQLSEAARGQSLTERRDNPAADEEMLGGGLRMLSQCGDLREDGAGLASDEGCFPAWACRPTETHPNKHCGAASLTRPAARLLTRR